MLDSQLAILFSSWSLLDGRDGGESSEVAGDGYCFREAGKQLVCWWHREKKGSQRELGEGGSRSHQRWVGWHRDLGTSTRAQKPRAYWRGQHTNHRRQASHQPHQK